MITVLRIINVVFNILILLIIASSLLSFFLPPWHEVRRLLDRIIGPLLTPIRRYVRPVNGLDLSPLVLLLLIYLVRSILFSILR